MFQEGQLGFKSFMSPDTQGSQGSMPLSIFILVSCYPLWCWMIILPIQNDAKMLENDWNPGIWVLIWEHSARAFQWIPTWQGLNGFQKSLHSCALDERSLSIGRVKCFIQPASSGSAPLEHTNSVSMASECVILYMPIQVLLVTMEKVQWNIAIIHAS